MGAPLNFEPQPGVYFVSGGYYNDSGQFVQTGANGGGSSQVFAQQTDVSVGTSTTTIAPAATTAHRVTLYHPGGSNTVFLAVGKAATLNSGVPLYPGGSWTSDSILGAVNGITSTGTETVTPFY